MIGQVKSIDILPDDVLLAVFEFCMDEVTEWWQPLVHVCRRWRIVVFGSPRRLRLRLYCTARSRVAMLLILPPFPLVIYDSTSLSGYVDSVLIALQRTDRVEEIHLYHVGSAIEKVLAEMQVPFPELTSLQLLSYNKPVPIVPDSFLGGSAPRLRSLRLGGISFPGLPKLLLSATHLVYLHLFNIPHSAYISPDVVVTALSTSSSLGSLALEFQSPQSLLDQASRRPPPLTRAVLPSLTHFYFKGVHEYLEDLVARIDAPRLINLKITFFNDIVFDAPQFIQFISRTPTLKPVENAHFVFGSRRGIVNSSSQTSRYEVGVSCRELDWQVSSLEQVCASHLPSLSTLEDLYIYEHLYTGKSYWQDNIENTLWLELLHRFTTVKNLYLSKEFGPRIVAALQESIGDRTTEVLPNLQNIFLEGLEPAGHVREDIGRFVAARQLSGHTITVSNWIRNPRREGGIF
jgi:F-box-like